jgi:hypothetical protein
LESALKEQVELAGLGIQSAAGFLEDDPNRTPAEKAAGDETVLIGIR